MDPSGLASQEVPYQREPLGNPRLTFDFDGNPLRRLLLGSKKNLALMVFFLLDGFARPIRKED
jgi:hypothetical protein